MLFIYKTSSFSEFKEKLKASDKEYSQHLGHFWHCNQNPDIKKSHYFSIAMSQKVPYDLMTFSRCKTAGKHIKAKGIDNLNIGMIRNWLKPKHNPRPTTGTGITEVF